jgi:hypothetical protein
MEPEVKPRDTNKSGHAHEPDANTDPRNATKRNAIRKEHS